ncbi:MAG: hypothetical protein HYU57_02395 [Micavibrio aeruginosavorus]|nr:hypothetical protein [Micavibrio aeruginosavorus]
MANAAKPAIDRLRYLLMTAAKDGETACISQAEIHSACEILAESGRKVEFYVYDSSMEIPAAPAIKPSRPGGPA